MRLTFLGKESQPNQSPTLYASDRDSYIVQEWIVTDQAVLARIDIGDDETVVEVPPRLMTHLAKDGLSGEISHLSPPIVAVLDSGNYIVRGRRVRDAQAMEQMSIPENETCVEVPKSAMAALIVGG
jgi:hypothetical protein